jgi:signal transduction histidine kinase/CheY-like chemotaxis protein
MLGLYVASLNPLNVLKLIGLALIQHNHSFMMYNNKVFKPVIIIISLVIVYHAQDNLRILIEDNNVTKILEIVKKLQYAWAPLYLFNQFCAMDFAKNYAKALEQTKEASKDLERSNQELNEMNQKLKNALSLLEERNKELNAAVKTRELFIAGVSHEFRNPLNSMMGNIELLSLEIKDEKWQEMLNTCKICGDVILGLMNNVLDVVKINAEKLELSLQPVNFHTLIEKVWNVSAIKMREKGLKGHLNLSGNLPQYLEVDSHRLNQILLNVIGNATKFTSNGFVKVILSWHHGVELEELGEPNYEFLNYSRIQREKTSPFQSKNTIQEESSESGFDSWGDCTSNGIRTPRETRGGSFRNETNRNLAQRTFATRTLSDVNDSINQIILSENDKHIEARPHHYQGENLKKQLGILKIEVIDSGCGISPSAKEKIFQPFTQADSSITRRFGGTGLGLYISKQLVNKMGGKMHAFSEENCGTNFCILIPTNSATAQDCDEDDEGAAAVNTVPNTTKETTTTTEKKIEHDIVRALVVEDIPLNQTLMLEYLKKINIEADVANNGKEAIKKFREKGFGYYSCVFMDIQMPVMDGMTASKKIRRYEMRKNLAVEDRIPIIMVTGNCTEMEKNYCLNPEGDIKASYFFRKPFVFEECKSCVKNILCR